MNLQMLLQGSLIVVGLELKSFVLVKVFTKSSKIIERSPEVYGAEVFDKLLANGLLNIKFIQWFL